MNEDKNKSAIGSTLAPDAAWLAKQAPEAIIEPDLPIVDPHHHLWDRANHRYLLDELLADTGSGHRVEATVFVECTAFYRAAGPTEMRPVGEAEFVNGVAAMSASGFYGPMQACAGIVGHADLLRGAAARPVLQALIAAGNGRFRGIRHAAGWDASKDIRNSHTNPPQGLYGRADFREGFAQLAPLGLSFEAWQYHTQLPEVIDLARVMHRRGRESQPFRAARNCGKVDRLDVNSEVFQQHVRQHLAMDGVSDMHRHNM
jgi:predicted TIM-barrel fold metal-dependent hydrolase